MEYGYGDTCAVRDIPVLHAEELKALICSLVAKGWRLAILCGVPLSALRESAEINTGTGKDAGVGLLAVLLNENTGRYLPLRTSAVESYPCLTLECPQAHWFEREIYEDWRIVPQGHPWLKPLRFIPAKPDAVSASPVRPLPGDTQYFRVEGADVHEVGVGPVHAGVIEPGHFRFQCYGEKVMHLEISLGFQHRGIEALLPSCPPHRALKLIECAAGDTSIAHTTAWCALHEQLRGQPASERGQALRSVALELERLACHTGDLGALGGDVGFLPTSAWCGRIRGDFLNMTALLCGNRFGRGMVVQGGVAHDVPAALRTELLDKLYAAHRDVRGAVDILLDNVGVVDRFEGTGTVPQDMARDIGLVGVAARASGLTRDARWHYPLAPVPEAPAALRTGQKGDVLARASVRSAELNDSVSIIRQTLDHLPEGDCLASSTAPLHAHRLSLALVEGWRGTVCHVGISGGNGSLAFHKMVDPSFHNWIGLALALRDQEISDFPLCNKSFNLSYCGHDL